MKVLQSSIFRAICAIIVGVLLIYNPSSTVKGITIVIGVLFLISGVISFAEYIHAKLHKGDAEVYDAQGRLIVSYRPVFPIVGLGSVLLGLILALMPSIFVKSLMYVLGAILILGAINQFTNLVSVNKYSRIPLWFWVCPAIILLTGLFVIIKPMASASLPLLIIGWCLILYGVVECVNAIKIHKERKRIKKEMEARESEQSSPVAGNLESSEVGTPQEEAETPSDTVEED